MQVLPASIGLISGESNNLPAPGSSFVGRGEEIAAIERALEAHRLVTLVGVGGSGKSRLAIETGWRMLEYVPHGIWWVDLADVDDPTVVPQTVAGALGLRPGSRPLRSLATFLSDRDLVLVLDNCEHLTRAVRSIAERVLAEAGDCRILATSREPLDLPDEACVGVAPLGVPAAGAGLEALRASDAAQLFVERARSASPGFAITSETAVPVSRICRGLDGIPLAIELAAALVEDLAVAEIASGIGDRFELLQGTDEERLARHQTLRGLVDWSHDRLTDEERIVFRALSVFTGGARLDAVAPVAASRTREIDAPAVVKRLVRKSLLEWDTARPANDEAPVRRVRMLETVRAYARERLEDTGEAAATRERHAHHHLELAESLYRRLRGGAEGPAYAVFASERDNFRGALDWWVDRARTDEALRLCAALGRYWIHCGQWSEASRRFARVLALGTGEPSAARGEAVHWASLIAINLGEDAHAEALLAEHLRIHERLGDQRGVARAHLGMGHAANKRSDGERVSACYARSLEMFRALGDDRAVALVLRYLGTQCLRRGDHGVARSSCEESLALSRALEDRSGEALALGALSQIFEREGSYEHAGELRERSLEIQTKLGETPGLADSLMSLGRIALRLGDRARARSHFERTRTLWRQLGGPGGIAAAECGLAEIALGEGAFVDAKRHLVRALAVQHRMRAKQGVVRTVELAASTFIGAGDHAAGARLLGTADRLREETGRPPTPYRRGQLDRDRAAARAALGRNACERALSAGRALRLDDVIHLVTHRPEPTAEGTRRGGREPSGTRKHTPDFRTVLWNGVLHEFTPTQAACVRILWEARDAGTPDVGQHTILETVGSRAVRLRDIFRRHPAWRSFIVAGETRGSYRLFE